MQVDKELLKNLVSKTQCYQEQVPVFRIRQQNATELHAEILRMALPFTGQASTREFRYKAERGETMTRLLLPEGATLTYFHLSGHRIFDRHTDPFTNLVAEDATKLDIETLKKGAGDLVEKHQLNPSGALESLEFERLWQLKASGINQEKQQGNVVVNRLVYAYRRSLAGLPVWGSASVFIKAAADQEVDSFGIDWRPVHDAHIHKAYILDPQDAATRVLEELQHINPERMLAARNCTVESFALGYFSDAKDNFQSFMQPVWVAKFISQGTTRMGRIVVVPATNTAYEPVSRKAGPPPFNERRVLQSQATCGCHKPTATTENQQSSEAELARGA